MSTNDIESGLIAHYVLVTLERNDIPLRATRHILGWLKERSSALSMTLPKTLNKAVGNIYSPQFKFADMQRAYSAHRDEVMASLKKMAVNPDEVEPLSTNINSLIKELDLSKEAAKIIQLVAFYNRYEQVEYFCDAVVEVAGPIPRATGLLIGENVRTVEQLMSPLGDIVSSGLLQIKNDGDQLSGSAGRYTIPWRIDLCLDQHYKNFEELRKSFLGKECKTALELKDFDHIKTDRDLVVGVLKGATKEKSKGINILLYGPAGSGKTELTKLAGMEAGLKIYTAGEDNGKGFGEESDRSSRLSDLVFAMRLLNGAKKSGLLFDEMEDVAWQLIRRGGSKLYLNRILENNPVPILWTSNNIVEIDPAVLRRMTVVIELKQPPAKQRKRIIQSLDERIGFGLSDEEAEHLSHSIEATPAILENALRAAKFSGGNSETVEHVAKGIVKAISGGRGAKKVSTPVEFNEALARTNMSLPNLTERLQKSGNAAFSLLMSGPPGTGKSAYARHLAKELGFEVQQKRASDLLGAFVGESEKLIAEAFETARENKELLIFDEADSFLLDRRDAMRSWEITQVNEMLTWMEDHPLPICFTTNLVDRFDRASLRRFTFHLRFKYLDKLALQEAYKTFFDLLKVPEEGMRLENLAPGDFAQARKQAVVLGVMDSPNKLVDLMIDISRHKPETSSSAMGFVGKKT